MLNLMTDLRLSSLSWLYSKEIDNDWDEGVSEHKVTVCQELAATVQDQDLLAAIHRAVAWFMSEYSEKFSECGDNFRMARMGNQDEVALYLAAKDRGCCGEVEASYYDRDTKLSFMMGCNYGH